jgi:hypothetical protein
MTKRLVRVVSAQYVREHLLRIEFSDGVQKTVDFSRWLQGEVFRPLVNKREFKRFFIEGGTVCWPNGADVAPETLRSTEDDANAA